MKKTVCAFVLVMVLLISSGCESDKSSTEKEATQVMQTRTNESLNEASHSIESTTLVDNQPLTDQTMDEPSMNAGDIPPLNFGQEIDENVKQKLPDLPATGQFISSAEGNTTIIQIMGITQEESENTIEQAKTMFADRFQMSRIEDGIIMFTGYNDQADKLEGNVIIDEGEVLMTLSLIENE